MDLTTKILTWAAAVGLVGWLGLAFTHGPKIWAFLWNRGREAKLKELTDLEKATKYASASLAATEEARKYQKERDDIDAAAKAELAKIEAERVAHANELAGLRSQVQQSIATGQEAVALVQKLMRDLEKQDSDKTGREAEFRLMTLEIDMTRAMVRRLALTDASPRQWLAIARFPSWPLVATSHSRRARLEDLIDRYSLPFTADEIVTDLAKVALDPTKIGPLDIVPTEQPWYASLGDELDFLEAIRRAGPNALDPS